MGSGSFASTAHKCAHLIAGLSDTHSVQGAGAGANRGHRTSVEDLAIVVALSLSHCLPLPVYHSVSNERQQ